MKAISIPTLLLVVLMSFNTFAQTEKGRLRIGGEISVSFSKSKNDVFNPPISYELEVKQSSFSFSPVSGIFLADGLEVGLSPSVTLNSSSTEGNPNAGMISDQKSTYFSVGPYLNYYIGSGTKGKPFVGVKPEIGWGNNSQEVIDPFDGTEVTVEGDTKFKSLSVMAGYALFLNDTYLLSFYAGYEFSHYEHEQDCGYEMDSKTGMFTLGVAVSTTFKR